MIKVSDVYSYLERLCPKSLSYDFDNSGIQIVNGDDEVSKILVCLDVTSLVIDNAIKTGANLIISHHPLIFSPVKSLDNSKPYDSKIFKLIKNDISHIALHTNLDVLKGGLNDYVSDILGIKNKKVIEDVCEDDNKIHGLGRIGEFDKSYLFEDIIGMISDALGINALRFIGDTKKEIKTVALCTGSGASLISNVIDLKADLYITGDIKYHDALNALENDLCVIDAGHYETECMAVSLLKDIFHNMQLKIPQSLQK